MAMTLVDFQEQINRSINMGKGAGLTVANMATTLTNAATALGTDTTKHDITIEAPAAVLKPDQGN